MALELWHKSAYSCVTSIFVFGVAANRSSRRSDEVIPDLSGPFTHWLLCSLRNRIDHLILAF